MTVLYVTSSAGVAGKTIVCAGLANHLLNNGKKVGFLKPIIGGEIDSIDGDALFMKQVLSLDEPIESICPLISGQGNLAGRVREVYTRVSPGRDVVIMEGALERSLVKALGAKMVIVDSYSEELSKGEVSNNYKDWGKYLLGVVVNKVPQNKVEMVRNQAFSWFGEAGINLLGVLPEDRLLFTLSVGELAEPLHGEILNNAEKSVELVENFIIGAKTVDPGPEYFGRKANKAVVVSGERPDIQMAALETSTSCLVISGNKAPTPVVRQRAEERSVPIISVESDTMATVMAIEVALDKVRFNQEKKLDRLAEIMERHFDFPVLYRGLGLVG